MTIFTKVKNNLIDTGIVVVVTLISLILWPLVTDWLLKLGGKLFNSDVMAEFLPTILIGLFQGTVTAWLIRNRRLYIAMLPAISLSGFVAISLFLTHIKFHSNIYSKDAIFIMNLLLWVISAFLSARWVLKRRADGNMSKKKLHKNAKGKKRFSFKLFSIIISSIIMPIVLLYAYQYDKLPELNIKSLDAYHSKTTQENEMRIDLNFEIENAGKSKTKNSEFYYTFPNWRLDGTIVRASPYDPAISNIPDLTEGEIRNITTYADIKWDNFIKYRDLAGGICLVIVLRWQGDNFVFSGRTFEKYFLFFLKPADIDNNKMVFQVQEKEQKSFTHWLMKETNTPDILKILGELKSTELIYGDTSRFD